jgi:hypothetical protein
LRSSRRLPPMTRRRVLITRSRDDGAAFARSLDLFLASDADAGVRGQPQLVVEPWVDEQGLPCREYLCRIERDSRGRLLVYWTATAGSRDTQLLRFDPVTGQRSELGLIRSSALSGSGRRLAVTSDVGLRKLYDEEDRVVELPDAQGAFAFVNDDIYYVDTAWRLQRLPPGGVSEVVVDRVDGFSVVPTTKGPLIVLRLSGPTDNDPSAPTGYAIFDPVSGKASAPIAESRWLGDQTLSPDGTSLVLQDPDDATGPRLAIIDRAAGAKIPSSFRGLAPSTIWSGGQEGRRCGSGAIARSSSSERMSPSSLFKPLGTGTSRCPLNTRGALPSSPATDRVGSPSRRQQPRTDGASSWDRPAIRRARCARSTLRRPALTSIGTWTGS